MQPANPTTANMGLFFFLSLELQALSLQQVGRRTRIGAAPTLGGRGPKAQQGKVPAGKVGADGLRRMLHLTRKSMTP